MLTDQIKKAVIKSQHCQRNWDLSKSMPKEDLDVLVFAATNCPSKQNVSFYKVHVITNRDVIEKIHENAYSKLSPYLFTFILRICKFLPCPAV